MRLFWIGLLSGLVIVSAALAAGKRPWQRRIGRDVDVHHKLAHQQVEPEMWPLEPRAPGSIDPDQFRKSINILCGKMPGARLTRYADALIEESVRFEGDPFLLAALMYDRSGCRPKTPDRETRHGVTRIDINMHAPHIRQGKYSYFVKEDDIWTKRHLNVDQFAFNKWKAEKIESNLYFAAAILKVFALQCADLDKAFGSVPHRHPVSHWFYGDVVKQAEPEDRVLTIRRRLLAYYNEAIPSAAATFNGVPLVSPLDGVPRLVIDYFGNIRGKKGTKGHRGIDIDGVAKEPVRAVAAGRVTFSGVDLPGAQKSRPLTPKEAATIPNRAMGPGGLYVRINHGKGFNSTYMHLESLVAGNGDRVEAGQIVGTLGRSGTRSSGPHLHLEFRMGTEPIDPAKPLADVLLNPRLL